MSVKRWTRLAALVGAVLMWATPDGAAAQEQEVAAAGKPFYEDNCMVCHGQAAKGDGPMVTFGLLSVPAADLTQLSKRNGGKFPFWKVYRVIDGREEVKGHGVREMPIWGDEFRLDVGSNAMRHTQVRGQILALVYYLQSLQEQ